MPNGTNAAGASQRVKKKAFMITPLSMPDTDIRRHADWVWKFAVRPVFENAGYHIERPDLIADPSMINDTVFNKIESADVCVADLSFLNANVFYELGVRHAMEKPVIHIAAEGTRIPFDNIGHRAISFNLADVNTMERFRDELTSTLETIARPDWTVSNPLTQARGRRVLQASADPADKLLDALAKRVENIEVALRRTPTAPPREQFVPARIIRNPPSREQLIRFTLQGVVNNSLADGSDFEAKLRLLMSQYFPLGAEEKQLVREVIEENFANLNAAKIVDSLPDMF